jgi:hypothetical protein
MHAFDHLLTTHNPTRLEARSETPMAALYLPYAFHAQDVVAIRDKGTCKEIAHSVAVERTVLFVQRSLPRSGMWSRQGGGVKRQRDGVGQLLVRGRERGNTAGGVEGIREPNVV